MSLPMITMPRGGPCAKDRKSTRLNSSHLVISYAVFCLKKKKATALAVASPPGLYFLGHSGTRRHHVFHGLFHNPYNPVATPIIAHLARTLRRAPITVRA